MKFLLLGARIPGHALASLRNTAQTPGERSEATRALEVKQ